MFYPKCSAAFGIMCMETEWWNPCRSCVWKGLHSDFLHGACSPTVSSSLNDVCCSDNALMWEIAVVCSMWQIIRHANQVKAAVESLIMVWVPHKAPLHPSDPPWSPSRLQAPLPFTSTPIPLVLLYPQTDRWTRGRGWSRGRRGEFGEDFVVWLAVALGVERLYVDLGHGCYLFLDTIEVSVWSLLF